MNASKIPFIGGIIQRMILAWRAYKFLKHVDRCGETISNPRGLIPLKDCISTFSYRKFPSLRKLNQAEKTDACKYARKKGYVADPFKPHGSPYIEVSSGVGRRLLIDRMFWVPYAAIYESFKPYGGISIGAVIGMMATIVGYIAKAHFKLSW